MSITPRCIPVPASVLSLPSRPWPPTDLPGNGPQGAVTCAQRAAEAVSSVHGWPSWLCVLKLRSGHSHLTVATCWVFDSVETVAWLSCLFKTLENFELLSCMVSNILFRRCYCAQAPQNLPCLWTMVLLARIIPMLTGLTLSPPSLVSSESHPGHPH